MFSGDTWSIESWTPLEADCLAIWKGDVIGLSETNEVAHLAGLDTTASTSYKTFESIKDLAERCSKPNVRPYLLSSSWKTRVADEPTADTLRLNNPSPSFTNTASSKTLNWFLYFPQKIIWDEAKFRANMPLGVTLPKRLVGKRQRKSSKADVKPDIDFLKSHPRSSAEWKARKTQMITRTIKYNDALRLYKERKSKN